MKGILMDFALQYQVFDVFTDRAFAGNPLAVVWDQEGLGDTAMQTIAREFNLSETVFIRPAAEVGTVASLRIFTPVNELPFAGHPTIGAIHALARAGRLPPAAAGATRSATLTVPHGPITFSITPTAGGAAIARATAPKAPQRLGGTPSLALIAQILGLSADQLLNGDTMAGLDHPAVWSSGGPNHLIVPLTDRAALSTMTVDTVHWRNHLAAHASIYAVVIDQTSGQIDARMFAPLLGITEDPATGSAAVALAGALAATGRSAWTVHQGKDMGRPSTIELDITITDGTAHAVAFAGGAVMIANGTLTMPAAM